MEREFQPGDKVQIRQDMEFENILGSMLAGSYWRPNCSVLSVVEHYENVDGWFVVRGPSQTGAEKVTRIIPGDFLGLVQNDDRKVGKACKLSQLDRGARFLDKSDNLMMKADAPLEHFTPKPGKYMSGVVFTVTEIRVSRVSGEFFTHSGNEPMGSVGFELDDVIKIVHPKYYECDDPDDVYVPQ